MTKRYFKVGTLDKGKFIKACKARGIQPNQYLIYQDNKDTDTYYIRIESEQDIQECRVYDEGEEFNAKTLNGATEITKKMTFLGADYSPVSASKSKAKSRKVIKATATATSTSLEESKDKDTVQYLSPLHSSNISEGSSSDTLHGRQPVRDENNYYVFKYINEFWALKEILTKAPFDETESSFIFDKVSNEHRFYPKPLETPKSDKKLEEDKRRKCGFQASRDTNILWFHQEKRSAWEGIPQQIIGTEKGLWQDHAQTRMETENDQSWYAALIMWPLGQITVIGGGWEKTLENAKAELSGTDHAETHHRTNEKRKKAREELYNQLLTTYALPSDEYRNFSGFFTNAIGLQVEGNYSKTQKAQALQALRNGPLNVESQDMLDILSNGSLGTALRKMAKDQGLKTIEELLTNDVTGFGFRTRTTRTAERKALFRELTRPDLPELLIKTLQNGTINLKSQKMLDILSSGNIGEILKAKAETCGFSDIPSLLANYAAGFGFDKKEAVTKRRKTFFANLEESEHGKLLVTELQTKRPKLLAALTNGDLSINDPKVVKFINTNEALQALVSTHEQASASSNSSSRSYSISFTDDAEARRIQEAKGFFQEIITDNQAEVFENHKVLSKELPHNLEEQLAAKERELEKNELFFLNTLITNVEDVEVINHATSAPNGLKQEIEELMSLIYFEQNIEKEGTPAIVLSYLSQTAQEKLQEMAIAEGFSTVDEFLTDDTVGFGFGYDVEKKVPSVKIEDSAAILTSHTTGNGSGRKKLSSSLSLTNPIGNENTDDEEELSGSSTPKTYWQWGCSLFSCGSSKPKYDTLNNTGLNTGLLDGDEKKSSTWSWPFGSGNSK